MRIFPKNQLILSVKYGIIREAFDLSLLGNHLFSAGSTIAKRRNGGERMAGKKYASDYRIEDALSPSGRIVSKRVYQGVYYRFQASGEEIRKLRLRVFLLTAATILLLLPMLFTNSDLGRTIYVVLPVAASFVPLYLLLAGARRLGFPEEQFTREHRDKTDHRISRASLWLSIFLGMGSVGSVVYCFRRACVADEIFCVTCLMLAWVSSLLMLPVRKKAKTVAVEAKKDRNT